MSVLPYALLFQLQAMLELVAYCAHWLLGIARWHDIHSSCGTLQALAKQLADARLREQASAGAEPSGDMLPDQASLHSGEDGVKPTLLVAPAECYSHRTCPEPITRDGQEPPPENVNRLKVLTHPGKSWSSLHLTLTSA